MNCYIRLKWALTEEIPVIKYYHEDRWAKLEDNLTMPIQPPLSLLEALHNRLTYLTQRLNHTDLEKSFIHPEHNTLYAWHGNHHLAHITQLKKEKKHW